MELHDVATAVVQELARHDQPISSARLGKALGLRASMLLRALAYLGEAEIAGEPGLGWVRQEQDGDRLMLSLATPPSQSLTAAPTQQHAVLRYRGALAETAQDTLAEETPIALVYNGISHAVMMATPADLEAFALGFSLSEGIAEQPSQVYDISLQPQPQGLELHITLASAQFAALKDRRRQLAGRTGCGLCGLESLQALDLDAAPLVELPSFQLRRSTILAALERLPEHQPLNAQTGALHVAAWGDAQGQLLYALEDVGRHNALDKLIGTLALGQEHPGSGWVLMSSRASYELVQKCARARIPLLATVSAPTAMAVRLAEQAGICLVGFVRESGLVVYTHVERVLPD